MAITVNCSNCGKALMEMPELPFMAACPGMKQWFGNVCLHCRRCLLQQLHQSRRIHSLPELWGADRSCSTLQSEEDWYWGRTMVI